MQLQVFWIIEAKKPFNWELKGEGRLYNKKFSIMCQVIFWRDNDEATGEIVQNTCVIFKLTQDYGTQTVLFLRIASFFC